METKIEKLRSEVRQIKLSSRSLLVEEVRAAFDCYKKQNGKILKKRSTATAAILRKRSSVVMKHIGGTVSTSKETVAIKRKRKRRKRVVPPKRICKDRDRKANYKCDICQEGFRDRRFFNKHVVGHEKDSNKDFAGFRCPICEKDFEALASLFVHQSWHEKADSFTCLICKVVFKEMDELTIHYNRDHMSVPTSLLQMLETNVIQRKKLKKSGKPIFKHHQCRYCPKSFSQVRLFTEHTLDHLLVINKIPPLTFYCPLCEEKFSKIWGVLQHSQYHPNESTSCPKCNESLEDIGLLILHFYKYHFEVPEEIVQLIVKSLSNAIENPKNVKRRIAKNRKPRRCEICLLSFINEKLYKEHSCKIKGLIVSGESNEKSRLKNATKNDEMETENEGPHKCSICEAEYLAVAALRRHMTISHTNTKLDKTPGSRIRKTYNCRVCSESFNLATNFRQHVLDVHHDNKELKDEFCFNCPLCDESFSREPLLLFHQRTIHGVYRQCPLCVENYSTDEEFVKHINESHSDKGDDDFIKCTAGYLCKKCGVRVGDHYKRKKHLQLKHLEETVKCEVCGQGFSNNRLLASHKIAKHSENPCICEECGKQFLTSNSLQVHKNKIHGKKQRVSCTECDKTFSCLSSYRNHYYSFHTNKKLYKCNVCQKEFGGAVGLHMHKITSCEKDKAKISKCLLCEKTFENYIKLSLHKANIHKYGNTEEDMCHVCSKKFSNSSTLYQHNRTHHSGANKQKIEKSICICNICGATRTHKMYLFDHWLTHKPEKSFECTACNTGFKLKSGFQQHRRHRHKANKDVKIKVHKEIFQRLQAEFNSVFKAVEEVEPEQSITETPVNQRHAENIIVIEISPAGDVGPNISDGDMDDILQNLESRSEDIILSITDLSSEKPENYGSVEPVNYIDFSRANVPVVLDVQLANTVTPDSPGEAIEDVPQSKNTTQIIDIGTESHSALNEHTDNDCINDVIEPTDYFSDVEVYPMEYYGDGDTLIEDRKPMIFENMLFHQDPFPRKLILKLEKLQTYNCNICNVVFHSPNLYKTHTKSRLHRSSLREFRLKERILKRCEKLKEQKEKKKGLLEKKNQSKKKIKRPRENEENEVRKIKGRKIVNKEALLVCPYCEDKLSDVKKYRMHLATHKVQRHSCLICREKFVFARALVKHYTNEHNGQMIVKCEICQKGFLDNNGSLPYHMNYAHKKSGDADENGSKRKRSKNLKYYKCDICGHQSESVPLYKSHLVSHNEDEQKCVYCTAGFKSQGELDIHYNDAHSGEMPIKCDECSQTFSTKFRLELHKKENHVPEIIQDPTDKKFICDICGAKFLRRNDYNYHKTTHAPKEDRRKFFCEFCGKSFFGGHSLTIHRRIHTGEKPFFCDQCDMTFISPEHLRHHMDGVHKQILNCEFCGKTCSTMKNLKSHQRRMHSQGIEAISVFSCSQCPKTFPTPEKLEKHSQLHDPNRRFACGQCNFRFNHGSNLNLHRKMVHKE